MKPGFFETEPAFYGVFPGETKKKDHGVPYERTTRHYRPCGSPGHRRTCPSARLGHGFKVGLERQPAPTRTRLSHRSRPPERLDNARGRSPPAWRIQSDRTD